MALSKSDLALAASVAMPGAFNEDELAVFAVAREESGRLRRSFETWLAIGSAVVLAKARANAVSGSFAVRGRAFTEIMNSQGLDWLARNNKRTASGVVADLCLIHRNLDKVQAWRSTLTDEERIRWASPQSVVNRCIRPRPYDQNPRPKATGTSLHAWAKLPAAEAARMLIVRDRCKAVAIARALAEQLGMPRPAPRSFGEVVERARAEAAA